jgi:hypothetical protein
LKAASGDGAVVLVLVALILAVAARVYADDRMRKSENVTDSNALLMR